MRGWLDTSKRDLSAILAVTLAIVPVLSPAQQPPGGTFKAETNLVLVPVVVSDKSDQHASGLQASDFALLEDGKPQKIASFEEIKKPEGRFERAALQPGEYSNAVASSSAGRGITVIVLDVVNTPFLDQAYAREQLLKFLSKNVSSREPIELVMVTRGGLRVVHDFTTNTSALIAALRKVTGETPTLLLDATARVQLGRNAEDIVNKEVSALDEFYRGEDMGVGSFQITVAMETTLLALSNIAQGLEGVPGRKSLIWATGGFPFDLSANGELAALRYYTTGVTRQEMGARFAGGTTTEGGLPNLPENNANTRDGELSALQPLFQRTMQALNNANIAIYPIDARGLVAYSSASLSKVRVSDVYGTEAQTHSTMNGIASTTGGRAYYNTNDIAGAFAGAANDSAQYYMLTYYAPGTKKPGWRKLQVSVSRPGLNVRTRTGYMAGVAVKKPEDLSKLDFRNALQSPLDYTGIPLRVRWPGQPAAGTGAKKSIPFMIVIPPQGVTIDTSANNRLVLEIVAVARNPQGQAAGRFGQKVEVKLEDAVAKQVAVEGINFSESIEIPPGQYSVRFVVRDDISGRVGSVLAPVTVQ